MNDKEAIRILELERLTDPFSKKGKALLHLITNFIPRDRLLSEEEIQNILWEVARIRIGSPASVMIAGALITAQKEKEGK